jgi:hypothetical protein
MARAIFRDGRAFALGVVGAATVLATMAGEFLMHNVAFAEDWHSCPDLSCTARTGTGVSLTYPATAVILPNGATLDITIYQVIVLALGALIFLGALACAAWTTHISRGVLAVAALLLALTLVFFHGQPPMMQKFPIGGCDASCFTHPELVPYQPIIPGDPLIDPFWFMAPAAALGLLTAGLAFLPVARREASKIVSTLPLDGGSSPSNRGR